MCVVSNNEAEIVLGAQTARTVSNILLYTAFQASSMLHEIASNTHVAAANERSCRVVLIFLRGSGGFQMDLTQQRAVSEVVRRFPKLADIVRSHIETTSMVIYNEERTGQLSGIVSIGMLTQSKTSQILPIKDNNPSLSFGEYISSTLNN